MPTAVRGGTETFWRTWGEGPPRAPMSHCSLAHSGVWDGLAQCLTIPSVAFDAPGHGHSGPMDATVDYQVQCLRATEDFVADGGMDVIGHSFGATVAVRLALERPEAVRGLVLIEPVLFAAARGTLEFDAHIAVFDPFVAAIKAGDMLLAAELFTTVWGTGVPWARMREAQHHVLVGQIAIVSTQNGAVFEDNAGVAATRAAGAVSNPGPADGRGNVATDYRLDSGRVSGPFAQCPHRCIEGAGHMLPPARPDTVADAIGLFPNP